MADADPETLRIIVDTKATIQVETYSRGGNFLIVEADLKCSDTTFFRADQIPLNFALRRLSELLYPVFHLSLEFKQLFAEGNLLFGVVVSRIEDMDIKTALERIFMSSRLPVRNRWRTRPNSCILIAVAPQTDGLNHARAGHARQCLSKRNRSFVVFSLSPSLFEPLSCIRLVLGVGRYRG
ncbi:MAG: hypothetical protein HGA97_08380 [Chlorobiaceae bacterium]|nr:hypothetical protein [Chlorobiaceae bacterium]